MVMLLQLLFWCHIYNDDDDDDQNQDNADLSRAVERRIL